MDDLRNPSQQVLKQRACDLLKERIISWQLQPGQFLSEKVLATELGMSRTPVREALRQLAQESLVRLEPRLGAFVAEVSVQDIIEVFELREALETWVVRKVAGTVPPERLAEFEAAFRRDAPEPDSEYWRALALVDQDFHTYLVGLAGNRRCEALYRNLLDLNQRIRLLSTTRQPERREAGRLEHLEILAALRRGDADAAASAMARHVQNARSAALQLR